MSTWTEHAAVADRDGMTIESVLISTSRDLPTRPSGGARFRIGLATQTGVDWLATWDQSERELKKYQSDELFDTWIPVDKGDIILVEVTEGDEGLTGISIMVRLGNTVLAESSLIQAASQIGDDRTREVLTSVIRQIAALSSNEQSHTVRFVNRG